jgi:hypothetical protein
MQYIITEGQSSAEGLHYAKLPPSVAEQGQRLLGEIGGGR